MASEPEPRVVCVDGIVREADGDVVIGSVRGVLHAWSLADGARLWRQADASVTATLADGAAHALCWTEDGPVVRVFDARSGVSLRVVRLDGLEGAEMLCEIAVRDGGYYVALERVVQRRALDGALLAQGTMEAPIQTWAFTEGALCVTSEDGRVRAFARGSLAPLWSREDFYDPSPLAAGEALALSGVGGSEDSTLLALAVSSGEERWRSAAFDRALAVDGGVLLARGRRGWLAALDVETGEVRWQLRTRGAAFAGAPTRAGFAVLTGDALRVIDRGGVVRACWGVTSPSSLLATSSVLVCGATSVDGSREAGVTATSAARESAAIPEVVDLAPTEGRDVFVPARRHLDEVRAVLREIEDLDEAWEALATRGIVPPSWVADPARRFVGGGAALARPWSRGAMLAFASDVKGVARVEALWRESQQRLAPWSVARDEVCRWADASSVWASGISDAFTTEALAALEAIADALDPAVLARVESAVARALRSGPGYDLRRAVLLGDTEWCVAASVSPTLGAHANPFAPLRAILAAGYGFASDGSLLARPFTDALDTLEALGEIPF